MSGDTTDKGRWCDAPSPVSAPHGRPRRRRSPALARPAAPRTAPEAAHRPTLGLAGALGANTWTRGVTIGAAPPPRERHRPAGAVHVLREAIARAKPRVGVPADARVVRGAAAGRDGVWRHRCRLASGGAPLGVDSARLAVHRRHRRATTDRRDVHTWLTRWRRQRAGARQGWRVVRGPRGAADDRRPRHRALLTTTRDRPRVLKRLQGLLAGAGGRLARHGGVEAPRAQARHWDGAPRPAAVPGRRPRAWPPGPWLTEPSVRLEAARRARRRTRAEPAVAPGRQVATRRGMGVNRAG